MRREHRASGENRHERAGACDESDHGHDNGSGGAMVCARSSGGATVRGHQPSRGHARVSKGRGKAWSGGRRRVRQAWT